MFKTVRTAALSLRPWKWHKDWNCERLETGCRAAAEAGAELIVAPEGFVEGYLTNEVIADRSLREQMMAQAEPLDGPSVQRFRRLARELKAALVFGLAARHDDGDVYNTAVFIDRTGTVCGSYAKTQFQEGYHRSWDFNRLGNEIRAFDTPLGRCGMLICNDRWNPDIARALALDGARFLCIITFGSRRPTQDQAVLARARENGIPIVQANVGRNLIISLGEVVALDAGFDLVTVADIEIPAPPCEAHARRWERRYMRARPAIMRANLKVAQAAPPVPAVTPESARRPRHLPLRVRNHTVP
jgi:predicted amidohydrolase